MKHPNHFGRWLACVLLCLLLAGCSMPGEQVQVEELLRAPKLSGDYGDVQTALNDWLGESAQLKYPMQGDLVIRSNCTGELSVKVDAMNITL